MLHAAVDLEIRDVLLLQALFDLRLHAVHKGLVLGLLGRERAGDLVVADGIQILEGQILKLPLDALHTEAVGDGGVNFHRFKRLLPLLFCRLVLHGAHVVRAVGQFDENDADVLGHRHEHLGAGFSICSSSLLAYCTRVSLETPSTRSATAGENSLAISAYVAEVSSMQSCMRAASMDSESSRSSSAMICATASGCVINGEPSFLS